MDTFESPKPTVKKMRVSKGDKGGFWSIIQVVLGWRGCDTCDVVAIVGTWWARM